ncbi:Kelch repeat-containing protein [Pseudomonas arsenicoxydans]|nr:kelch repeat-containing protein [Pseudomonas arsenicoxydans]
MTLISSEGTETRIPATSSWSLTGSLNQARQDFSATLLQDGKVLVAAGADHEFGGSIIYNSVEIYDPETARWTQVADMNTGRYGAQAILLTDGTVLVTAGAGHTHGIDVSEIYDPKTDAWTNTGVLNAQHGATCASISLPDGRVLLAGGYDVAIGFVKAVEIYDPKSRVWERIADMNVGRNTFSMTLMGDGKVLVAGGNSDAGGKTNSVEELDLETGVWTPIAPMLHARVRCSAFLLPSGHIMVAGGITNLEGTAEFYNPETGSWRVMSMQTGHAATTATRMKDGKILFIGGANDVIGPTREVELFDPETGEFEPIEETHVLYPRGLGVSATQLQTGEILVAGGQLEPVTDKAMLFTPFFIRTPKNGSTTGPRPIYSGLSLFAHTPVAVIDQYGELIVATVTDAQGQWSVSSAIDLQEGSHRIQAVISGKGTMTVGFEAYGSTETGSKN